MNFKKYVGKKYCCVMCKSEFNSRELIKKHIYKEHFDEIIETRYYGKDGK